MLRETALQKGHSISDMRLSLRMLGSRSFVARELWRIIKNGLFKMWCTLLRRTAIPKSIRSARKV